MGFFIFFVGFAMTLSSCFAGNASGEELPPGEKTLPRKLVFLEGTKNGTAVPLHLQEGLRHGKEGTGDDSTGDKDSRGSNATAIEHDDRLPKYSANQQGSKYVEEDDEEGDDDGKGSQHVPRDDHDHDHDHDHDDDHEHDHDYDHDHGDDDDDHHDDDDD
ncbi:hypothetical protein H6P81_015558 [Aristolochia fimbriata]|uniref:Secreted protein n=1 Tax=Aristolochia fimbriata TaxID=158543 RepID=A0AAV7E5X2_ARIFI|nr:hypothetical protein H6P81_015558 [Aristolochia fimbriata]